jgi:hypothetical protein
MTQVPQVRLAFVISHCHVLAVRAEGKTQGVLKYTHGMASWEILESCECTSWSCVN